MSIEATAREFVAATKKRAQARSHLSALRKKWLADNDAFWDKYESDGMEGHNDMLEALHDREQANAEYRRAKSRLFRACTTGVEGRPPTRQEDDFLHRAVRDAGTLVAPGKLAHGVAIPQPPKENDRG
jgi:hypothetical protein